MKKFWLVLFSLSFLLLNPSTTQAHVSGVPFLKINDKYSPANPSYYSSPELDDNIPQDLGAETYLVGQQITLEVDSAAIPVNKELIDKAVFRWSWDEGSTDYSYGLKVSHTYDQVGSHLVSLDIKAPEEPNYTPYDTIQLDVVPHAGYRLPKGLITLVAKELKTGAPVTFEASFNTNPQSQITDYYWFVNGQKIPNQPTITHTFTDQDFFQLVFLKYTDKEGLVAYSGAWVEGLAGELKLDFPPNFHDQVSVNQTNSGANSFFNNLNLPLIFMAMGLGVLGLLVWGLLKRIKK